MLPAFQNGGSFVDPYIRLTSASMDLGEGDLSREHSMVVHMTSSGNPNLYAFHYPEAKTGPMLSSFFCEKPQIAKFICFVSWSYLMSQQRLPAPRCWSGTTTNDGMKKGCSSFSFVDEEWSNGLVFHVTFCKTRGPEAVFEQNTVNIKANRGYRNLCK